MSGELLKPQKMRSWSLFRHNISIKHFWPVPQQHQCYPLNIFTSAVAWVCVQFPEQIFLLDSSLQKFQRLPLLWLRENPVLLLVYNFSIFQNPRQSSSYGPNFIQGLTLDSSYHPSCHLGACPHLRLSFYIQDLV